MSDSSISNPQMIRLQDESPPHAQNPTGAAHADRSFRLAFEQAAIGLAHIGVDGRLLQANRRFCEIMGYTLAELRERSLQDLTHPGDCAAEQRHIERLLRGESPSYALEKRLIRSDGTTVWASTNVSLARSATDEPEFLICAIDDISAHKQIERELRESEARFRTMADSAPVLLWMAGADGLCDFFNQPWLSFTGRTLEQEVGFGWTESVHPDDVQRCLDTYSSAFRERRPFVMEYRLRRADGVYRWVLDSSMPRFAPDGEFVGYIGSCIDITERQLLEQALTQKTIEQEVLLNSIPALVYYKDRNSAYIAVNQTFAEAVDLPVAVIPGKTDFDLFPTEEAARFRRDDREVMQSGQSKLNIEEQATLANGKRIWLATSKTPYRSQDGEVIGLVGFGIDISARKQAEALASGQKRVLEMIALGAPLTDILNTLVHLIEGQAQGMLCMVMLLDETGQHLRSTAAPSFPESFKRATERFAIGPSAASCGTAAFLKQSVIVTDIATDPLWADYRDFAAEYGLRAAWSTPIISSAGEVLGTFAMSYREPRIPDVFDFHLIEIATHISGIAIARTRTEAALQQAVQRLNFHVENTPLGMVEWDQHYRVLRWSQEAERIFGWRAEEVLGKHPNEWQFVYPDDIQLVDGVISEMLQGVERRTVTHNRNYTKDGRVIHCVWYCSALFDSAGSPVSVLALVEDITTRKRAEDALRFVAEASVLLTSSLDYETTLSNLAGLIVPQLADWCSIDLIGEDGSLQTVVVAHTDPAKVAWAREVVRRYTYNPNAPYGLPHVIRTGQPEIMADVPDSLLASVAQDEEHLDLLRKVGFTSYICVPLIARRRTLGALTFVNAESRRRYDTTDLELAQHLARRAASAVDNAWLYRQAQEGITARDEFLSIASHELKTPITALQLQTQTLLRSARKGGAGALSAERLMSKLEHIDQQTERLAHLTNDLLDVTRIRAGRIELRLEEVDLAQTVRDVISRFEEQIKAAGCTLTLRAADATLISADRPRLEQVVTNLLSNALKYGAGKPIEVTVEADPTTAQLIVRDNGIGIAPENLERIFVRFERAVSSRNYGGLGLGLYIARQIVEAFGGTISVTSKLGVGSTFVVALPRSGIQR